MRWRELSAGVLPSASLLFCCLDTDENRRSVGRVGRRRHHHRHHRLAESLSSTSCQLELHAGCVQQANGGLKGLEQGGVWGETARLCCSQKRQRGGEGGQKKEEGL